MKVTLTDQSLDVLSEIGSRPGLSLTAKGLVLCLQTGGAVPAYDPKGNTQADKGYRELIRLGYARAL